MDKKGGHLPGGVQVRLRIDTRPFANLKRPYAMETKDQILFEGRVWASFH